MSVHGQDGTVNLPDLPRMTQILFYANLLTWQRVHVTDTSPKSVHVHQLRQKERKKEDRRALQDDIRATISITYKLFLNAQMEKGFGRPPSCRRRRGSPRDGAPRLRE